MHAGDHLRVQPCFDARTSIVLPPEVLEYPGGSLKFEVLLPPSYGEQENKRYPVVYAQDGQALWSRSEDPFGIWSLDTTLDQLFELGAVEEMIVVGIDTSERRIERLSPMADPEHGGGEGPTHLSAIIDALVPSIDGRFRTRAAREHRALLGSSMGGLFAFYGAWTRPDVFGKAICLSSSFWWAQRELIRAVQTGPTPSPRPELYVDSGAAASAFEKDPSVRDGYQHSRSMSRALLPHGYAPGNDLHRLTFTGQTHDAASWAARIAIPVQLLFAPVAATVIPHEVAPAS